MRSGQLKRDANMMTLHHFIWKNEKVDIVKGNSLCKEDKKGKTSFPYNEVCYKQ
jgi:hypothetical protein